MTLRAMSDECAISGSAGADAATLRVATIGLHGAEDLAA
jgi:hypothetical protein